MSNAFRGNVETEIKSLTKEIERYRQLLNEAEENLDALTCVGSFCIYLNETDNKWRFTDNIGIDWECSSLSEALDLLEKVRNGTFNYSDY